MRLCAQRRKALRYNPNQAAPESGAALLLAYKCGLDVFPYESVDGTAPVCPYYACCSFFLQRRVVLYGFTLAGKYFISIFPCASE